jgi:hypothetical protein
MQNVADARLEHDRIRLAHSNTARGRFRELNKTWDVARVDE